MECDTCAFYEYDEDYEEYFCSAEMDEDDLARLMRGSRECPFYRCGDEYAVIRRQFHRLTGNERLNDEEDPQ
ncbi:MAG: hypothetical protein IJU67_07535 [Lachnospiraceae bacterium]|nr:hypothetical protein [Lachnospiraceae bacterium]